MSDPLEPCLCLKISSLSEGQTFAKQLGSRLAPGDVLLLRGDLGAGKTTLTQAIAEGLEVPQGYAVTSPTYALMHEYPGRCPLYHFDLYRLQGEDDIEGAGLLEYLGATDGVSVVEWAARLGTLTPPGALTLHLSLPALQTLSSEEQYLSSEEHFLSSEEQRLFRFQTSEPLWCKRIEAIAADLHLQLV